MSAYDLSQLVADTERTVDEIVRKFRDWVEITEGCWLWRSSVPDGQYAKLYFGDRGFAAHRVAYVLLVGPIPEGLELDHLCRVTGCVNPAHLEAVTHQENMRRSPVTPIALRRQKTHCVRGHPYSGDNLRVNKKGWRACRTCYREVYAPRHRKKLKERRDR